MKRLLLLLVTVLAFFTMSSAQDVYSVGTIENDTTPDVSVLYKNGELLYSRSDSLRHETYALCLNPSNDEVFWVDNVVNIQGYNIFSRGTILRNNEEFLVSNDSVSTFFYNLFWHQTPDAHPDSCLFVAGSYTDTMMMSHAAVWRGSEASPLYSPTSEWGFGSAATDVLVTNGPEDGFQVYYCGFEWDENGNRRATLWRDSLKLYTFSDFYSEALSIGHYHGSIYTLVMDYDTLGNGSSLKVFRNANCLYTLTGVGFQVHGYQVKVDAGDVYVSGSDENGNAIIWKNGEILYNFGDASVIRSMDVTPEGLFFTVLSYGVNYVLNSTEVLYSYPDCTMLVDLAVTQHCDNEEVRTLPYFEGFEMGATDWNCWTVLDEGHNYSVGIDGELASYWHRLGTNAMVDPFEGQYSAAYRYHWDYPQEGWLISPKLYLQPNRSQTLLSFQSYEYESNIYEYEGVWVSLTGTDPEDFFEVWSPTPEEVSDEWKEINIDLSAYQGETIYIAFKFNGDDTFSWLIDNVSLTEDYEFCSTVNEFDYLDDFEEEDLSCYYIVDNDHSGNQCNWQLTHQYYFSEGTSVYHPADSLDTPQEGWLITRPFDLHDIDYAVLTFWSLVDGYGEGMGNTVWIALDVEHPEPSDFTTMLWSDVDFHEAWTEIGIGLDEYAGHTVNFAFKYEGGNSHAWYIDDLRVVVPVPYYMVTVNTNNPAWGYVEGGGEFEYGASCTLAAYPYPGFDFLYWTKEGEVVSTSSEYTFVVTEDATYIAVFEEHVQATYTINTSVMPDESAGVVMGGGTYEQGTVINLAAVPGTGWYFVAWLDGNTTNPREVVVTGDATYTARFAPISYTLTLVANPVEGGTVTGGGSYHYGQTVQISAIAAEGYRFTAWNDGVTLATRVVTVTDNVTYVASFELAPVQMFTITAEPNDPSLGEVTGGGVYPEGSEVVLTAIPLGEAEFVEWSDGVAKISRVVTVTEDATYTAIFITHQDFTITVESSDPSMGTVFGGGTYPAGTEVTITALAYPGYYFNQWGDGNTDNPRVITVTGDAIYKAHFSEEPNYYYILSLVCNPNEGTVIGAGNYAPGTIVTVAAVPNVGYQFSSWNDGVTENPRTVEVNDHITLVAFFLPTSVGEDVEALFGVYPNPVQGALHFTGLEAETPVSIYDATGTLVMTAIVSSDQEVNVSDLTPGFYFARIRQSYVKFVIQ